MGIRSENEYFGGQRLLSEMTSQGQFMGTVGLAEIDTSIEESRQFMFTKSNAREI